jgi:hypothetical protein
MKAAAIERDSMVFRAQYRFLGTVNREETLLGSVPQAARGPQLPFRAQRLIHASGEAASTTRHAMSADSFRNPAKPRSLKNLLCRRPESGYNPCLLRWHASSQLPFR